MSEVSASQTELIGQFSNVTGAEEGRAKFYLESAAWNLQVALASFYEDDQDVVEEVIHSSLPDLNNPSAVDPNNPPNKPVAPPSKFATIGSLKKDESSSDEDEGQAFYAGGSERSGQQVIGPGKKKKDIISDMFKSAMDHGAEVVDGTQDSVKSKLGIFKGTGYRLGASETDSPVTASSSNTTATPFRTKESTDVVLKLWRNGFSVDDGPLRDYQDPANQPFLNSINNGEIPNELVRQVKGAEVTLNMEDHRSENYVAPKTKLKAFSGPGHKLGSPAPTPVFNEGTTLAAKESELMAQNGIKLDDSQPTTNVQIRLTDGTRVSVRVNLTHTVRDLYRFVTTARPQYSLTPFVLMTTFPNRELDNQELTLKEESLMNAVIVQRLK